MASSHRARNRIGSEQHERPESRFDFSRCHMPDITEAAEPHPRFHCPTDRNRHLDVQIRRHWRSRLGCNESAAATNVGGCPDAVVPVTVASSPTKLRHSLEFISGALSPFVHVRPAARLLHCFRLPSDSLSCFQPRSFPRAQQESEMLSVRLL